MGFDAGRADGIFGQRTEIAVREFQRNVGLAADGTCGPATLRALARLRRTVVGGRAQWIRESEQLHRARADAGRQVRRHRPWPRRRDRGAQYHGLDEASLAEDLAARLEGRLAAVGAQAYLTRSADLSSHGCASTVDDAERAALANGIDADLLVSLHIDASPNPLANGVAAFYFGTASLGGHRSVVGARLAALIQDEVVTRTDLLDCRTHPKTLGAAAADPDARRAPRARLPQQPGRRPPPGHPEFRDTVAEAVVVAVQRLYLPDEIERTREAFPLAVGSCG